MTDHPFMSETFFEWLTNVAYDEATDLVDLDTSDLADLWYQVDALSDIIRTVAAKLRQALADTLDRPYALPDGRVLKAGPTTVRNAWRQQELLERLIEYATVHLIDPTTGQQRAVIDPAKVRGLFEPTHAVTKLLAVGVKPQDFCDEQRTNALSVIR